ncbi:hypothetical protein JMUB7515_28100 [Staphylococcus aureus]
MYKRQELELPQAPKANVCLLYTSDAADDMQCVDLGGRRIIKKVLYTSDAADDMQCVDLGGRRIIKKGDL